MREGDWRKKYRNTFLEIANQATKVLTSWNLHKVVHGSLTVSADHVFGRQGFRLPRGFLTTEGLAKEVFGSGVLDQGVLGADSEHAEHALLLLPGVAHQARVGRVQRH